MVAKRHSPQMKKMALLVMQSAFVHWSGVVSLLSREALCQMTCFKGPLAQRCMRELWVRVSQLQQSGGNKYDTGPKLPDLCAARQ
jgi:hypothetical protein